MTRRVPGWGEQIPLFKLCAADPHVVGGGVAQFGKRPIRIYPFGEAPQGVKTPYAVWQILGGEPEAYLDCPSDHDEWRTQVDVYADEPALCREAAGNIIAAIECYCSISFGPTGREPETRKYRITFDADWQECRPER